MQEELRKKAETIFYFMTKEAARDSFIEFLDSCGADKDDWDKIKQEISDKTGIIFKYL